MCGWPSGSTFEATPGKRAWRVRGVGNLIEIAANEGGCMAVEIRELREQEALQYRDLQRVLDRETPFMLWEPGESPDELAYWDARLKPFLTEPHHRFWVAEESREWVGFLRLVGHRPRRLRHACLLVMGIRESHWGQGIGSGLVATAITWAEREGIARLELTVVADNRRAIALYHKMGFRVEGFRRRSLQMADGRFLDEYSMARLLSPLRSEPTVDK